MNDQPAAVQGVQAPLAHHQIWPRLLLELLGAAALVGVHVNAFLCLACGGWLSPKSHPLIICMGVGFLVAAGQCAAAALGWRRQAPPRLYAWPAVLLTALLWACSGTSLAHQAVLLGCSPPDSLTILLCMAPPTFSGAASLWLALTEQPHWLVLGTIRAAAGAGTLVYFLSFSVAFGSLSLPLTLICGGVLGLLHWDSAWRIVRRRLLPASLLPFVGTWAQHGLVADGHVGLQGLLNSSDDLVWLAIGVGIFELAMLWLHHAIKA